MAGRESSPETVRKKRCGRASRNKTSWWDPALIMWFSNPTDVAAS